MDQVTVYFINKAKALAFMEWLCECGEQYYWGDMVDDACNSAAHFTYNFQHRIIHASGQLAGCVEEEERNENN